MRKIREGTVISDRMNKTRVVLVTRRVPHPLYKKVVQQEKKYYVHDENNSSHVGDKVRIIESRPLSRLKNWCLLEILEKAK